MNQAQRIQLERIKLASFNDFDGNKVAEDLEKHEDLWVSFVFGRFKYSQLIELRDLRHDIINGDTLYMLCKEEKVAALEKLAKKWEANEIGHYNWKNGKMVYEGTVDFSEDELWSAYGRSLEKGMALIRIWWD